MNVYECTLVLVGGTAETHAVGAAIDLQVERVIGTQTVGGSGITDGDKGDITVSGSGTVWTIDANAVTEGKIATGAVTETKLGARSVTAAKLFAVGHGKLIGRHGAGDGDAQEIGLDGGLEFQGGNIRRDALTGDVTASAGSNVTTIATGSVNTSKLGGDITTAGKALLDDVDSAAQRATLGLGTAATAATGDFAAASHTHTLSNLTQSGATTGQVAQWNGTNWVPVTLSSGVNYQAWFTSGTFTWTNPSPSTRRLVRGRLVAGGGGGGSGRKGAAGSVRCGGGGGAPGGQLIFEAWSDELPSSVNVTVGAGGAGGASVTANDTNGNAGVAGGVTTFIANRYQASPGGAFGGGGTNAAGAGGGTTGANLILGGSFITGPAGGAASGTGGAGGNGTNPQSLYILPSGGAGGGISTTEVRGNGGNGGRNTYGSLGESSGVPFGGSTDGANGTTPAASTRGGVGGFGGSGGAGHPTGNGGNGSAGVAGGGGGGGGAATNNLGNSGAGGAGGDGLIEIWVL